MPPFPSFSVFVCCVARHKIAVCLCCLMLPRLGRAWKRGWGEGGEGWREEGEQRGDRERERDRKEKWNKCKTGRCGMDGDMRWKEVGNSGDRRGGNKGSEVGSGGETNARMGGGGE